MVLFIYLKFFFQIIVQILQTNSYKLYKFKTLASDQNVVKKFNLKKKLKLS